MLEDGGGRERCVAELVPVRQARDRDEPFLARPHPSQILQPNRLRAGLASAVIGGGAQFLLRRRLLGACGGPDASNSALAELDAGCAAVRAAAAIARNDVPSLPGRTGITFYGDRRWRMIRAQISHNFGLCFCRRGARLTPALSASAAPGCQFLDWRIYKFCVAGRVS